MRILNLDVDPLGHLEWFIQSQPFNLLKYLFNLNRLFFKIIVLKLYFVNISSKLKEVHLK